MEYVCQKSNNNLMTFKNTIQLLKLNKDRLISGYSIEDNLEYIMDKSCQEINDILESAPTHTLIEKLRLNAL